jgi:hypothetical protein
MHTNTSPIYYHTPTQYALHNTTLIVRREAKDKQKAKAEAKVAAAPAKPSAKPAAAKKPAAKAAAKSSKDNVPKVQKSAGKGASGGKGR